MWLLLSCFFFLSSDDFCCINFLWRGCGLQVCCFLFYFERISLTLALTLTLPWLVYWSPCVLYTYYLYVCACYFVCFVVLYSSKNKFIYVFFYLFCYRFGLCCRPEYHKHKYNFAMSDSYELFYLQMNTLVLTLSSFSIQSLLWFLLLKICSACCVHARL